MNNITLCVTHKLKTKQCTRRGGVSVVNIEYCFDFTNCSNNTQRNERITLLDVINRALLDAHS